MHYSKETPSCSTLRVITANFRVSETFGFLWYTNLLACHAGPGLEAVGEQFPESRAVGPHITGRCELEIVYTFWCTPRIRQTVL